MNFVIAFLAGIGAASLILSALVVIVTLIVDWIDRRQEARDNCDALQSDAAVIAEFERIRRAYEAKAANEGGDPFRFRKVARLRLVDDPATDDQSAEQRRKGGGA